MVTKWGYDILQKIRGMYAFAIWDKETKLCFVPETEREKNLL